MTGPDAVVLLQMGGPARLDDVEPFLEALFSDPDLIRLPPWLRGRQARIARRIARRRAAMVRGRYETVGGGGGRASPIGELTRRQAEGLEGRLGVPVHVAMRYTEPRAESVVATLRAQGAKQVLLLPLYPHWSGSTSGSGLRDFVAEARRQGLGARLETVRAWGGHPAYVDALEATCREAQDEGRHLVLSAHGLPRSYVRQGDPYPHEVRETVALLRRRLEGRFASVRQGYQSRVGPVRWIGPETGRVLKDLAREGAIDVAIAPLGFVTDHIETLYDIDVTYRGEAEARGMSVRRVPSLNDRGVFLDALAQVAASPAQPVGVVLRST